jgi:hypothetical protein
MWVRKFSSTTADRGQVWWYMLVIPAIQAEVGVSVSSLVKAKHAKPYQKNN